MEFHLHLHTWIPDDVKAVMIIVHGMAEHGARYDHLAKDLNQNGIGVVAPDLRGHGKTAGTVANLGYKEDGDFFGKTIGDLKALQGKIEEKYLDRPIFLLGHSMGSMLIRAYISIHGEGIAGAVISGTGGDPGLLGRIGFFIAKNISWFRGRKHESKMLEKLSFGKFNDEFKPTRTEFDWLSRKNEAVDQYVADPYCGTTFTAGFWVDFLKGLQYINSAQAYKTTPKDLPLYIFSGDKDPVGDQGKGVKAVFNSYVTAGANHIKLKLYPDGRHEMLNESNQDQVKSELMEWLKPLVNTTV